MKYPAKPDKPSETEVAPFAGAWIEIISLAAIAVMVLVAPFAGAWIEIPKIMNSILVADVAPFAGAWIEIIEDGKINNRPLSSLPSRERGLK